MTKEEALKLAQIALERGETKLRWEAITAIKEALAQTERPWVGLTFEEKQHAIYLSDWKTTYMEAVIEYIEAKLKEKNT